MKSKLGVALSFAVLILPLAALAQVGGNNAGTVIQEVIRFINTYIIPLIVGIAILYFLLGVLTYVRAAGDEDKRKEGRGMMVYGIIAIAVMLSVIGLVSVLVNSFNFNQGATLNNQIPSLPQK